MLVRKTQGRIEKWFCSDDLYILKAQQTTDIAKYILFLSTSIIAWNWLPAAVFGCGTVKEKQIQEKLIRVKRSDEFFQN